MSFMLYMLVAFACFWFYSVLWMRQQLKDLNQNANPRKKFDLQDVKLDGIENFMMAFLAVCWPFSLPMILTVVLFNSEFLARIQRKIFLRLFGKD